MADMRGQVPGKRLPKAKSPRFESVRAAFSDAQTLSPQLRADLWELLPAKRFKPTAKEIFLNAVAEVLSEPQIDTFPISETRDAAKSLRKDAEQLARSLRAFDRHAFRCAPFFGELVHLQKHAGKLSVSRSMGLEQLLALSWEASQDLNAFATHYLERSRPTRQTKPEIPAAKSLFARLVERHRALFGCPPVMAWFHPFARRLSEDLALPCGYKLVAEAVRAESGI